MERTVPQTVHNELREKYEEMDLEAVFTKAYYGEPEPTSLTRRELKEEIRERVLTDEGKYFTEHRTPFPADPRVKAKYEKAIDVSTNQFISDLLRYGVLKEPSQGMYDLVEVDPTVFESEHNGIRIKCEWAEPYTVYRHRMNTSGEIDVKANGDPAIDGRTLQDPLAW